MRFPGTRATVIAVALCGGSGPLLAVDPPARPPAAAPANRCEEKAALPIDAFGFTSGSDVAALGSWGGSLELGGGYGALLGSGAAYVPKAQVSTSPLPCLEIGPSLSGAWTRSNEHPGHTHAQSYAFGGGIEVKYKLLIREADGVGLTISAEPVGTGVTSTFADPLRLRHERSSGSLYVNATKILIDRELVADRLYGAINLEHDAIWAGDGAFARSSALVLKTSLAAKLADSFYLAAEGSHQRAYDGLFLNRRLGHAWFAGPAAYWEPKDGVSLSAALGFQLAGHSKGRAGALDVEHFNRQVTKVKLGYDF